MGKKGQGHAPRATILRFRYLLKQHQLTEQIFAEIRSLLEEKRLLLKSGTIVDATIIAAPPSTKNEQKARDPEMHQTRKGKDWHFGMKAHIGTDRNFGREDIHLIFYLHGPAIPIVSPRALSRIDTHEVTQLMARGQLHIDDLITHKLPLTEVERAVKILRARHEPVWMSVINP